MLHDAPLSISEARDLVENIASNEYGWVSQNELESLSERTLKTIQKNQITLGACAKTLASTLCRSQAQFALELIKNSEHNAYSIAKKAGTNPFIKFHVYHDKIVIECNGDGFTTDDVQKICKVIRTTENESSIDTKGNGFKSVFLVASRVYIQSGFFSFCFEHEMNKIKPNEPKNSGIGMVTPIWCSHVDELSKPLTKITLTLLTNHDHQALLKQFAEIPDTLLLFLEKLKHIRITTYELDGSVSITTNFTSQLNTGFQTTTLTKTTQIKNQPAVSETKIYCVFDSQLYNLPADPSRSSDKARMVLAFPLNNNHDPIIQQRDVYSFHPMGDIGFTFFVQSDFIAQPDGQSLLENARNKDIILQGVPSIFASAVLRFCAHPKLQYSWTRFFPQSENDPFLVTVRSKIRYSLTWRRILRPRNHGELQLAGNLRIIPENFKDIYGNPLLADSDRGTYLATEYNEADIGILETLGLKRLSIQDVISRIDQDLSSSVSKLKSASSSKNWHSQVAKYILEESQGDCIAKLKSFELIPLIDGKFHSISDHTFYFPDSCGMPIPTDIGFEIVDPAALENSGWRRQLFSALGVKQATLSQLREAIISKYQNTSMEIEVSLENSVSHLRCLYLSNGATSTPMEDTIYSILRVYDHTERLIGIGSETHDIYIPSDHDFDTQKLLQPDSQANHPETEYPAIFLHPSYIQNFPVILTTELLSQSDWELWLQNCLGMRKHPRLADPNLESLSDIMQYLVAHRGYKFLGILKTHWAEYSKLLNPSLIKEISNLKLPCFGSRLQLLNSTYLHALHRDSDLYIHMEPFNILEIGDTADSNPILPEEWSFLTVFGVKVDDLDFFLDYLRWFWGRKNMSSLSQKRVFKLYEKIQVIYLNSKEKEMVHNKILTAFRRKKTICVPKPLLDFSSWAYLRDCLWEGPSYMMTRTTLSHLEEYDSNSLIRDLFHTTLEIPNADLSDILQELEYWSNSSLPNVSYLLDMYERIEAALLGFNSKALEEVTKCFRFKKLTYVLPQENWYSLDDCIWSDHIEIDGRVNISSQYASLRQLFLDLLGVKRVDMKMAVNELKRLAEIMPAYSSTIMSVKNIIHQINRMSPVSDDLESVLNSNILPVRRADHCQYLMSTEDDFAIIDCSKLGKAFSGKASMLSFELDEVRVLQPFLTALNLDNRYLSQVVKRNSSPGYFSCYQVQDLTRSLRRRSYALYRCASHYRSQRCSYGNRVIYDLLLKAQVFASDEIRDSLVITQNGQPITAHVRGSIHISEEKDSLKIYVPESTSEREICYLRHLPIHLSKVLMCQSSIDRSDFEVDKSVLFLVSGILKCSDAVLSSLLEEAGIVSASFEDEYIDERTSSSSPNLSTSTSDRDLSKLAHITSKLLSTETDTNSSEFVWDSEPEHPGKRSKKDKKKKRSSVILDLETPPPETLSEPTETASSAILPSDNTTIVQLGKSQLGQEPDSPTISPPTEVLEVPVDDWAPIAAKKSKKNKKRNVASQNQSQQGPSGTTTFLEPFEEKELVAERESMEKPELVKARTPVEERDRVTALEGWSFNLKSKLGADTYLR